MQKENSIVWKMPSRIYMKPGCTRFAFADIQSSNPTIGIIFSKEFLIEARIAQKLLSKYSSNLIMLDENYQNINKTIDIVVFISKTPNKEKISGELPNLKQIYSVITPTLCVDCLRVWDSTKEVYILDQYFFTNEKEFSRNFIESNERILRMNIFWYLFFLAQIDEEKLQLIRFNCQRCCFNKIQINEEKFQLIQFYLPSLINSYLRIRKKNFNFLPRDFHITAIAAIELGQFVPKNGINKKNKKRIMNFLNKPMKDINNYQVDALKYLLRQFGVKKVAHDDVLSETKKQTDVFLKRS